MTNEADQVVRPRDPKQLPSPCAPTFAPELDDPTEGPDTRKYADPKDKHIVEYNQ